MKVQWCWRCKMDIPMLDEEEWNRVMLHVEGMKLGSGRFLALAEYERITGFHETNFNALFHHPIANHGPPCPRCGKVLRTRVAFKCFECGLQVHEPNWTYLFRIEVDAFVIKGRGTVVVADKEFIAGKLEIGDQIEFRHRGANLCRKSVIGMETFMGSPMAQTKLGVLLDSNGEDPEIKVGADVWLVHSPRWPGEAGGGK